MVVVQWFVVGLVVLSMIDALRQPNARRDVLVLVRGLRLRHLVWGVGTLLVVVPLGVALLQVPGLGVGWWMLLGGEGSAMFGQTTDGSLPLLVPFLVVGLLVFAAPLLVQVEEVVFRKGSELRSWRRRILIALLFGLLHLTVGIPLGIALALSVAGVSFTWVYLRRFSVDASAEEAVMESSRVHLAYNYVVIGSVLAGILFA